MLGRETIIYNFKETEASRVRPDCRLFTSVIEDEAVRKRAATQIGEDLWTYKWDGRDGCTPPTYPKASKYIAEYDGHLAPPIQCQEQKLEVLIGCSITFSFREFGVEFGFHREHLLRWREIVDRAAAFLKSKEFREAQSGER